MSITNKIINILAGYDVRKKEKQLKLSLSELQGDCARLTYKIRSCNTQLKQKDSECAMYVEENSTLKSKIEQMHKQILDLRNRFQELQTQLSQKENQNDELGKQLHDAISEKDLLQTKNVEFEDRNQHLLYSTVN